MTKTVSFLAAAAMLAAITAPAHADKRTHHHHGYGHHHAATAKIRYGGKPGLGYWRPGPANGYGFAFSTYKGDPFGRDDYSDGGNCFYMHHRDHCVKDWIFSGFR